MRVWLPKPRAQRQALGQEGAPYVAVKLDARRLWLAVSATALVLLGVAALTWAFVMGGGAAVAPVAGTSLPSQGPAADFALTNQDEQRVRLSDFRGRVVLITFFYASCPDFCPLMNFNLKQVRDSLSEPSREQLVLLSITFDPEYDTPEILNRYAKVRGFDVPGWHFLTGTQFEIEMVTDEYGVVYQLVPVEEHVHPDGEIHHHSRAFNHLAQALLIDQEGVVRKAYLGVPQGEEIFSPQLIVKDVQALLASQRR